MLWIEMAEWNMTRDASSKKAVKVLEKNRSRSAHAAVTSLRLLDKRVRS